MQAPAPINYSFVKFGAAVGAADSRHVMDKVHHCSRRAEGARRKDLNARARNGNAGRRREFPVAAGVDYDTFNAGL
jgi:hypothetical protein